MSRALSYDFQIKFVFPFLPKKTVKNNFSVIFRFESLSLVTITDREDKISYDIEATLQRMCLKVQLSQKKLLGMCRTLSYDFQIKFVFAFLPKKNIEKQVFL